MYIYMTLVIDKMNVVTQCIRMLAKEDKFDIILATKGGVLMILHMLVTRQNTLIIKVSE